MWPVNLMAMVQPVMIAAAVGLAGLAQWTVLGEVEFSQPAAAAWPGAR